MTGVRRALAAVVLAAVSVGCSPGSGAGGAGPSSTSATAPPTTAAPSTTAAPTVAASGGSTTGSTTTDPPTTVAPAPVDLPDGSAPGLSAEVALVPRAAEVLERLQVRGRGPKTGYSREQFGPRWSDDNADPIFGHNGCDTRNDVLRRDLTGIQVRLRTQDCVVVAGTLLEPYTGRTVTFAKARAAELPIDHVVPLSYAWQLGAAAWTPEQRQDFANDPRNLLVADRSANEQKGDSGPASWLPPNKPIRCAYVLRFAEVAEAYDLPVTPADQAIARAQCEVAD